MLMDIRMWPRRNCVSPNERAYRKGHCAGSWRQSVSFKDNISGRIDVIRILTICFDDVSVEVGIKAKESNDFGPRWKRNRELHHVRRAVGCREHPFQDSNQLYYASGIYSLRLYTGY